MLGTADTIVNLKIVVLTRRSAGTDLHSAVVVKIKLEQLPVSY